jgi:hypothetical protein
MIEHAHLRFPAWSREIAYGMVGWLLFMAALEPGVVARASANGVVLQVDRELIRILGAACIGALTTPVLMALIRHFPIGADGFWKRLVFHAFTSAGLALVLIAVSCILAPVLQVGDTRPFMQAFPDHRASNWLLLTYVLGAMTGIAHAVQYFSESQVARSVLARLSTEGPQVTSPVPVSHPRHVTIRERGLVRVVELASVDWIEAQGNYLALHAGASTHLLRETMSAFESRLDPEKFTRIHRRFIVAVDRVQEVAAATNGDGIARLHNGTELRISRNYRAGLIDRLSKH